MPGNLPGAEKADVNCNGSLPMLNRPVSWPLFLPVEVSVLSSPYGDSVSLFQRDNVHDVGQEDEVRPSLQQTPSSIWRSVCFASLHPQSRLKSGIRIGKPLFLVPVCVVPQWSMLSPNRISACFNGTKEEGETELNLLLSSLKRTRFTKPAIESGTCPVKLFPSSCRYFKLVHLEISEGSSPCNLFW